MTPSIGLRLFYMSAPVHPGFAAKIAVISYDKTSIDPVGALLYALGSRVQAVVNELQAPKIRSLSGERDQHTFRWSTRFSLA